MKSCSQTKQVSAAESSRPKPNDPAESIFCNGLKFIWQGAFPSEQQPVVLQAGLASASSAEGTHQFSSLNFLTAAFARTITDPISPRWTGSRRAGELCFDSSVSARLKAAASDNSSWWKAEEVARSLRFPCEIKISESDPEGSSESSEPDSVSDFIRLVEKCSRSSLTAAPSLSRLRTFPSLERPFLPVRSWRHMLSLARVYFLKCKAVCLRPVIEGGVTGVGAALQLLTYPDKRLGSADKIARRSAGARRSQGRLHPHVRLSLIRCQKWRATLVSFISLDCVRMAGWTSDIWMYLEAWKLYCVCVHVWRSQTLYDFLSFSFEANGLMNGAFVHHALCCCSLASNGCEKNQGADNLELKHGFLQDHEVTTPTIWDENESNDAWTEILHVWQGS